MQDHACKMTVLHVAKICFLDLLKASRAPLRYGVVALQERERLVICTAWVVF